MFGEELFLMIHTWNPVDAFISMDAFMYTLLCFGMDAFMYTLLWSDAFIDPIRSVTYIYSGFDYYSEEFHSYKPEQ